MQTKRKISLTIDKDICLAIDEAAIKKGIPKSQLVERAFNLWLKKETEDLMAKGYDEMYEEDKAISEMAFIAQLETIK